MAKRGSQSQDGGTTLKRRSNFPPKVKAEAAFRSGGKCESCSARIGSGGFHYDHIVPDALGGQPTVDNCRVLCLTCHRAKTGKRDVPQIAKANRQHKAHIGAKRRKGPPMPGTKASGIRKRMDGTVERRS